MLPGLLILVLFMAYPFFLGIYLSLTDKLVGFSDYKYIGLDNFRWYWDDPIFSKPSKTPFIYGFGTVPFKLLLGLGLALILNERFPSAGSCGPACCCPGSCQPRSAASPG